MKKSNIIVINGNDTIKNGTECGPDTIAAMLTGLRLVITTNETPSVIVLGTGTGVLAPESDPLNQLMGEFITQDLKYKGYGLVIETLDRKLFRHETLGSIIIEIVPDNSLGLFREILGIAQRIRNQHPGQLEITVIDQASRKNTLDYIWGAYFPEFEPIFVPSNPAESTASTVLDDLELMVATMMGEWHLFHKRLGKLFSPAKTAYS